MPHAIVIPPGGGVPFGNVEFLALSEHTPRINVSIITHGARAAMARRRTSHTDEDDAFYVLDGELTFVLGDEDLPAPAGTFVLVPPSVGHTFANRTAEPVRVLNIHAPGRVRPPPDGSARLTGGGPTSRSR